MGHFSNLEYRAISGLDDKWYNPGGYFWGGTGKNTKSGASVNEYTAMNLAIVWCCIKILSEDSASLPLHLYRRLPNGGKERAIDHPMYKIMHDQPNPEMTSFSFRETYNSHLISWGNGYAEKEFAGRVNRLKYLWPITPNRVTKKRDEFSRKIFYEITLPDGTKKPMPQRQILHTPGLGFNGLIGYSPLTMAKETIGLNISLEEFGERYFSNGTNIGGILEHPGTCGKMEQDNIRASIDPEVTGLSNAHRYMILEQGMKFNKLTIPPNDSQFLESRQFQAVEIGTKIYRLPPHMYGEMRASTNNNIEHQGIEYVTGALRPWLVRLEQSYNMNLLDPEEQGEYFFEHLVDGLLRGDLKSRYDAYMIGRTGTWLSADDVCEMENRNPLPDGQGKKYENPNITIKENVGEVKKDKEKIRSAFSKLFLSTFQKIVNRETLAVDKAINSKLNKGSIVEFNNWVDTFYNESPDHIRNQIFPLFSSFINIVSEKEDNSWFIEKCVDTFISDYISNSKKEINEKRDVDYLQNCIEVWNKNKASALVDKEIENILRRL